MSFDISRSTFDPRKDYAGVVMEQGRVQTDADWNEWLAELSRRIQAQTLDTLGQSVYPLTTPYAFLIEPATVSGKKTIRIGVGRLYVDGILVENHGNAPPVAWDPALAEPSNAPQPPPASLAALDATNSILFSEQPYLGSQTVPTGSGPFLAYLDVWRRPVTYIEDPSLVDPAIGVDTSGRMQTVWQVKFMPMPTNEILGAVTSGAFQAGEQVKQDTGATATLIGTVSGSGPMYIGSITGGTANGDPWTGVTSGAVFTPSASATPAPVTWSCQTPDSAIPWPTTAGQITTSYAASPSSGPCCLTTGAGYTGPENQLYRVEIHAAGGGGGSGATFKWSRENGSVQTGVTAVGTGTNSLGATSGLLTVQSLGRDQVLGFTPGAWIEIITQANDDDGVPGVLYQIDSVDPSAQTITLTTTLSATYAPSATNYVRIVRWDQSGKIYRSDNTVYHDLDAAGAGDIPVPTDGTVLILENGVTVQFGLTPTSAAFEPLNYWQMMARTSNGTVDQLSGAPPLGVYHHYTKLAIVDFSGSGSATACRTPWPPAGSGGGGCCCPTITVGQGGDYSTVTQALTHLPTSGGEIVVLPGTYYEAVTLKGLTDVTIRGCGRHTVFCSPSLQSGAATPSGSGAALSAVFTIEGCHRLELSCFRVEAADGDVGVLIDGPASATTKAAKAREFIAPATPSTAIVIKALEIEATTRPALASRAVKGLWVHNNLMATAKIDRRLSDTGRKETQAEDLFPTVYLRGVDMLFERNSVGLGPAERLPSADTPAQPSAPAAPAEVIEDAQTTDEQPGAVEASVRAGLQTDQQDPITIKRDTTQAAGGVQIGGGSKDVCILENRIVGGARNGITLGDVITLGANGRDTGRLNGLIVFHEDPCKGSGGFIPPNGGGSTRTTFAAGDLIENLFINRNIIIDHGMSGIGPVGFFDFRKTAEVVSLCNVGIVENLIERTLTNELAAFDGDSSTFGYGAISLPDVKNLIVRDNKVTDFGPALGAAVCGVYVLYGEGVEISRNQIRETRDLAATRRTTGNPYHGVCAGIYVALSTPPMMDGGRLEDDLFAPGAPALRVEENVVRMGLGLALLACGAGPFAIADNHLSTGIGSTLAALDVETTDTEAFSQGVNSDAIALALTVGVVNFGFPIDFPSLGRSFAGLASGGASLYEAGPNDTLTLRSLPSGPVLFADNICQFEGRATRMRGLCSVLVLGLDHVQFSDNHLWFDAPERSAAFDGFLVASTVQAVGNRFQEALTKPVVASALTYGRANITTNNISTYCLDVGGAKHIKTPNIEMFCKDSASAPVTGAGLFETAEGEAP